MTPISSSKNEEANVQRKKNHRDVEKRPQKTSSRTKRRFLKKRPEGETFHPRKCSA